MLVLGTYDVDAGVWYPSDYGGYKVSVPTPPGACVRGRRRDKGMSALTDERYVRA